MPILQIGKQGKGTLSSLLKGFRESGFTLIEMLIAITILAIVMSLAVLNLPNHDERYWRNDLDHLVSSLNAAQDESAMGGNAIQAQIDSQGWRFYQANFNGASGMDFGLGSGGALTLGASVANVQANQPNGSGLMPDVYKPQFWNKAMQIAPVQLTLGGETVNEPLNIAIAQDTRRATLLRNRNGYFQWAGG